MKANRKTDLIWGLVLILAGLLFLGQNLGYFNDLAPIVWVLVFAGLSVISFVTYFARGTQNWGWLFPAMGAGAIAAIIGLAEAGQDGAYLGTIMLWAMALPFGAAYLAGRQENWWALIPGGVLAVIGAVVLLADNIRGEWIGALIMFGIALPFAVIYLRNRQHWWALIPAYTLGVLGVIIVLSTAAPGEWIGALVMFAIALPFAVVYLRNREHWWALIPAFVMGVLGIVILVSSFASGEFIGAFFMFAIAAPFLIVFLRNRDEHWWALIPAGIMGSIGLVVLLAGILPQAWDLERGLGGLLFLGWAATFGLLWLGRKALPTAWAKYPAAGFGITALIIFALPVRLENIWAAALIVIGAWMLLDNARQPKLKG